LTDDRRRQRGKARREYGRFFGTPPTKDIHRLREEGLAAIEALA